MLGLTSAKHLECDIPEGDLQHGIDKAAVCRILNKIAKHAQNYWSGTKNCAIALLLFARRYTVLKPSKSEVENPLGCSGSEEALEALRLSLYELQTERNGFVHHDLATWDDVKRMRFCFERCLDGLLTALYSGY